MAYIIARTKEESLIYGWSANLGISILSNFENLVVHDCRYKPQHADDPKIARYSTFHFKEFIEQFDTLYDLLSFESIASGSIDEYFSSTQNETSTFDNYFLQQIEDWRQRLATEIVKQGKGFNEEDVNFLVQRLLILTNPAIPNLIKIGMTTQEDVKIRMGQLYTSGVPLPFECVYAAIVNNIDEVEKALHTAFGPNRINPKREFFEIVPAQAIAIIKLMVIEDVTPKVAREKEEVDEVDREAGEEYARKKRPRFSLGDMNIPIGSELVSVANGEIVTRVILDNTYHVAPGPYWIYNGRRLRDIYNETYIN